jgi:hypothetical protein
MGLSGLRLKTLVYWCRPAEVSGTPRKGCWIESMILPKSFHLEPFGQNSVLWLKTHEVLKLLLLMSQFLNAIFKSEPSWVSCWRTSSFNFCCWNSFGGLRDLLLTHGMGIRAVRCCLHWRTCRRATQPSKGSYRISIGNSQPTWVHGMQMYNTVTIRLSIFMVVPNFSADDDTTWCFAQKSWRWRHREKPHSRRVSDGGQLANRFKVSTVTTTDACRACQREVTDRWSSGFLKWPQSDKSGNRLSMRSGETAYQIQLTVTLLWKKPWYPLIIIMTHLLQWLTPKRHNCICPALHWALVHVRDRSRAPPWSLGTVSIHLKLQLGPSPPRPSCLLYKNAI